MRSAVIEAMGRPRKPTWRCWPARSNLPMRSAVMEAVGRPRKEGGGVIREISYGRRPPKHRIFHDIFRSGHEKKGVEIPLNSRGSWGYALKESISGEVANHRRINIWFERFSRDFRGYIGSRDSFEVEGRVARFRPGLWRAPNASNHTRPAPSKELVLPAEASPALAGQWLQAPGCPLSVLTHVRGTLSGDYSTQSRVLSTAFFHPA